MSVINMLKKKRDGEELTKEEVYGFVRLVAQGTANDAQIGAMLMAMYIRDLTNEETFNLTSAIVETGEVLRWKEEWEDQLVDKHSTGGVGDKISIVLTPVLAACGLKVPMLTGRGLGFTGGTLDKLESIPGFQSQLSVDQLQQCLETADCFMAGATPRICPVDKVLYEIRDVTSTVGNINLIVASIISKKVASGIKKLIIDVKVGEATFCKDLKTGRSLAEKLIAVSRSLGVTTRVVISRMDAPLGWAVGNALEVEESVQCLKGEGDEHIMELVLALGGNLLQMSGTVQNVEEGQLRMLEAIENGAALKCFHDMIVAQGANKEAVLDLCFGDPRLVLPQAKHRTEFTAKESGYVKQINGLSIARACWELGTGRKTPTDIIDPAVGVRVLLSVGNAVDAGTVWLQLHHTSPDLNPSLRSLLNDALVIHNTYAVPEKIIIDIIQDVL